MIVCLDMRGLLRDLNLGPLAPEARIIPLDQAAGLEGMAHETCENQGLWNHKGNICVGRWL